MDAQEYRTGLEEFRQALAASHQDWEALGSSSFREDRQRWLANFTVSAFGCLTGGAQFIETRLTVPMGPGVEVRLVIFDAGSVIRAVGRFRMDEDSRFGTEEFSVFPRSAIEAVRKIQVRAATDDGADFPGHAEAEVDYGEQGTLMLGRWEASAGREADTQFARFLPSLLIDLGNVRR